LDGFFAIIVIVALLCGVALGWFLGQRGTAAIQAERDGR